MRRTQAQHQEEERDDEEAAEDESLEEEADYRAVGPSSSASVQIYEGAIAEESVAEDDEFQDS